MSVVIFCKDYSHLPVNITLKLVLREFFLLAKLALFKDIPVYYKCLSKYPKYFNFKNKVNVMLLIIKINYLKFQRRSRQTNNIFSQSVKR